MSHRLDNLEPSPCSASQIAPATVNPETPLDHVAYTHDGTLEGLFSAIFETYVRHEDPEDVVDAAHYVPRLGQSERFVETDWERARRVRVGIERQGGRRTYCAVVRASTADGPDTGTIVYRFVRLLMATDAQHGAKRLLDNLSNPVVADLDRLETHVVNEEEKVRQFVRFSHLENDVWYARCNPNASVVPLVMSYFSERFNVQPFIIYDENHHLAGVYDGNAWRIVRDDVVNVPPEAADEAFYRQAWQRFYDATNIVDRYNPELRRHFMPVRLWKNLPEMAPRQ